MFYKVIETFHRYVTRRTTNFEISVALSSTIVKMLSDRIFSWCSVGVHLDDFRELEGNNKIRKKLPTTSVNI